MLSKIQINKIRSTTQLLHHKLVPNTMGKNKKSKFPFLFKATDSATAAALPWPWPACATSPKTLSFRANANSNIYKTMNSAYLDDKVAADFAGSTPDSFFSIRDSPERRRRGGAGESFSSAYEIPDESAVIGGLRSDRLFFDPGETSSILEEAKAARASFPYSDGVRIMAMDSNDPFLDFRASMAEMVEAHRLESWECLEELLTCYLRVNQKSNHGYIVGAFVDLLIHVSLQAAELSPSADSASAADEHCSSSSTTTTTTNNSFTSPLSFTSSCTYSSTSPCLSSMENEDEIAVEKSAGG